MFMHFYHSTTRKYVINFGNLFDNIHVVRRSTDGKALQQIKIPIRYSPKHKWYALLNKHPANTPSVATILPRIGFELTNISRDDSRKLNPVHKLVTVSDDKNKMLTQFVPVPYKLNFELYVMALNTDDAMQIIEQIIPYFNPDFNSTLDLIPGLDYKYDIRINMSNSPSKQDVYDGNFQERRVLTWLLNFEVDAWYFGPVQKSGVIKRVQVDLHSLRGSGIVTNEEVSSSGRTARIVIKPGLTSDGKPTTLAENSIPFWEIDKEDDYGFIEELYEFDDGLRYDPVSGKDVPFK